MTATNPADAELLGLMHLTDHLADEAVDLGIVTDAQLLDGWADGCISAGLGGPRDDN